MGRLVYLTDSLNVCVHDRPDCPALQRGQRFKKRPKQIKIRDLTTIRAPKPCKVCWPDAPRLKVRHHQCTECRFRRPMPCKHNGGVLVTLDENSARSAWVWPENAHHYTLANPSQLD
jgi:hypothetical protein